MSVDVEDYFHVAALAQSIDRSTWNDREYRAEENTRRLLDLFEASNMKSTFFVLGWVAKRSPQLIREIHDRGHEVASHGMSHLLVYNPVTRGRTPLVLGLSKDGKVWETVVTLESQPGEYSYPAIIQTPDGLVHITYTWKRQRVKHVTIDPTKLAIRPLIDGKWPD